MKLPDLIELSIEIDKCPRAGLMARVEILVSRKNNFQVWSEPSGAAGDVVMTREYMLEQCDLERQLFLMDYDHPEGSFTGNLVVRIAALKDVQRAIAAYEMFKGVTHFPVNYLANLQHAAAILAEMPGAILSAKLRRQEPPIGSVLQLQDVVNT